MENIKFNVGSIVRPAWDDEARGKVTEVKDSIRLVEWFQGDSRYLSRAWHVCNLKFVKPAEKYMNTIKCKQLSNDLEIEGGFWKHVVVSRFDNKIVAAFITEFDAEDYVKDMPGSYYIREVDNCPHMRYNTSIS